MSYGEMWFVHHVENREKVEKLLPDREINARNDESMKCF